MLDPTQFANSAPTGEMPIDQVEEMRKALVAGQTYDIKDGSGGQALRIQSLDTTMQATIQDNEHFKLFNALAKPKASATVDEWTEQSGVGGFLGGSSNGETADIRSAEGVYTRRVGLVKYLMTRRQISFVLSLQNNLADAEATEYSNGALQLLTDAEFLCFEGDSSVVPTEYDGIYKQMVDLGSNDHIIDMRGTALASQHAIMRAAALITGYGNFGVPTDLFLSQQAQADLDNSLDPAFRVPLPDVGGGGVSLGAPVVGIRTSWGPIKTQPDVFVRDEAMMVPHQVNHSTMTAANSAYKGSLAVARTNNAGPVANSQFAAGHVGYYRYGVAALGPAGESDIVYSDHNGQISNAGDAVTLAISGAGATATGFAIYRSQRTGTANTDTYSDMRLLKRVPTTTTGSGTASFQDLNSDIPGTTKAYILNLKPSHHAIAWRQYMPMVKFPLYPTVSAIIPWAQLLFGYLRISKRKHHIVIKNILANSATWRPFG
jgi:hypothetical protein